MANEESMRRIFEEVFQQATARLNLGTAYHNSNHLVQPEQSIKQQPEHPPLCPQQNQQLSDAEVMEIVRKWNIHFDGAGDPYEFTERMEELATCYFVPRDRLPHTLPDKLRGKALEWWRNNRDTIHTWEDFITAFRAHFLTRRFRTRLQDEIRKRTQGPREKGKDFVTSIQTMFRHSGHANHEEELERIYENLRTEYRLYIRPQDFDTLPELLQLIEQYEDLIREHPRTSNHVIQNEPTVVSPRILPQRNDTSTAETRHITPIHQPTHHNPFSRPQNVLNPTDQSNANTPAFDRNLDCWRCGQRGHSRFRCSNARIPMCSHCGRTENPRNCPCQSGNGQRGPTDAQS